ncbi:MAG: cysteine hydrolase [Deltaproteobacteria bacterium]|nr:MAG: cysteine hydrolase [Deltaproteobacteria bacterium]
MNVDDFDPKKTALLFFDILNGYYHAAEPAAKARMKPWIDNAVRLMKAGREAGMPVFFAKGNHRPDSATSAVLETDTDMGLRPWPDGVVKKGKMHVTGGDRSSEVIPELDPRPEDYYIPKYRWSAFYQTYLDLALRARGIDTVIISGGSSDVGVASTIFAGRDMDYNMLVVSDACGTSHDQRAHDLLMTLIFPRMARVRTTDQTLQMIQETRRR